MTDAGLVSIVIVSFNTRDDLARCLESLHRPLPSCPHEVVVVDNASVDGSPDVVRQWPAVRLIEAGANLGFARATNLGIRASRGELLLLLNPDTVVPDGAIDALVRSIRQADDVAVVGPRLVDDEGRAELSFGRMIGPLNELRQKVLVRGHARRMPFLSTLVERLTSRPQFPDWVSGACLLVRRADAEAVGLLDERYFMYAEDVDFCAAIRKRGRRILFTPDVIVRHRRGQSAAADRGAALVASRRSQLAFYDKHHPRWTPVLRAYLQLRGIAAPGKAGGPGGSGPRENR